MSPDVVFQWLYDLPLADAIRTSSVLFPMIESTHVIAFTLVVGSILIVDLRLTGLTWNHKSVTEFSAEVLPWTWGLFAIAVSTGSLLFISHAPDYAANTSFRLKMLFIALAGTNMLIFQLFTYRGVNAWDNDPLAPPAARVAGAISLLLWILVVCCGRWIGFTMHS